MIARTRSDIILMTVAAGLALFGTLMVYSASAMHAHRESAGASQFTYFYKQFGFTLVGLLAMYVFSRIDYRRFQNPTVVFGFLGLTVACLLAVSFSRRSMVLSVGYGSVRFRSSHLRWRRSRCQSFLLIF
jgi:Bacterial cell division membrane protein